MGEGKKETFINVSVVMLEMFTCKTLFAIHNKSEERVKYQSMGYSLSCVT